VTSRKHGKGAIERVPSSSEGGGGEKKVKANSRKQNRCREKGRAQAPCTERNARGGERKGRKKGDESAVKTKKRGRVITQKIEGKRKKRGNQKQKIPRGEKLDSAVPTERRGRNAEHNCNKEQQQDQFFQGKKKEEGSADITKRGCEQRGLKPQRERGMVIKKKVEKPINSNEQKRRG